MSIFSKLLLQADEVFSKFVRQKGMNGAGYNSCYTCGSRIHWKQLHAGHFVRRDSMPLRYDERNVKPCCFTCNCTLEGNLDMFEIKLKYELGPEGFKDLESKRHSMQKFARFELQEIIDKYSKLIKR